MTFEMFLDSTTCTNILLGLAIFFQLLTISVLQKK